MLTTTKLGIVFLMVAGTCFSQPEAPKAPAAEQHKYFQLNFVVKELEQGKVSNARAYSMMVPTFDAHASIRSGNRVPIPMGGSAGSVNYVDVGVNIDCRALKEIQNQLALAVTSEISSAATESASSGPPLIRNARWNSDVIVQIGKPTVIFSSDDPTTKRQVQLELTATPIK
jgi:hypothetical protein